MTSPQTEMFGEHATKHEETRILLTGAILFLLILGVMMLLFSATYIQDVNMLREVPEALWNFVCGVPVESGIALPLLLTLAIVSFGASGVLAIIRWRLRG